MSLPTKRQSSRLNQQKLFAAITENDISAVKSLLRKGFSVSDTYTFKRTQLHVAASVGNEEIVDVLLKHKAQVTDVDQDENTTLHFAAENGNVKVFMKLLNASSENGGPMNINVRNIELETPLHTAVYKGQADLIDQMIKAGADVNARKRDDGTPLHLAAATGNVKAMLVLIKNGALINAVTKFGSTPLHCAIFDRDYDKGETVPHYLISRTLLTGTQIVDQEKVVSILLDCGADPNALNSEGVTPLSYAVIRNHLVLMKRLLQSGATVDYLNLEGQTALHQAAKRGSPEVIRILLDSGANVNLFSYEGYTPLQYAVKSTNLKIISMLVQAGAEVNEETVHGYPIHFLCLYNKDAAVFQLLLECGININAQNSKSGITFFHRLFKFIDLEKILAICMEFHIDCNILNYKKETALENFQSMYYKRDVREFFLIKLMVKMESDKKVEISKQNMQIINDLFPTFYQNCKDELEEMKKRKVWGHVSFNDLLSKSLNELSAYIRNKKLMKILDSGAFKEFKIYGDFVKIRMQMALARKELLDKCLEALELLLSPKHGQKLPRFIGLDILKFLNSIDLENLSVISKV